MHVIKNYAQHSPHLFTSPTYGAKQKHEDPIAHIPLSPEDKVWIEQIVGVFIYYAQYIDFTMLLSIRSTASAKSTDTIENLKKRIRHFLDYAAPHPNEKLRYFASDMHLWAQSDAS